MTRTNRVSTIIFREKPANGGDCISDSTDWMDTLLTPEEQMHWLDLLAQAKFLCDETSCDAVIVQSGKVVGTRFGKVLTMLHPVDINIFPSTETGTENQESGIVITDSGRKDRAVTLRAVAKGQGSVTCSLTLEQAKALVTALSLAIEQENRRFWEAQE